MKKQGISLLGCTGSIGTSTLEVVRHHPDLFQIEALAARSNIDLLEQQAKAFSPSLIAVYDAEQAKILQNRLPHVPVLSGMDGLIAAASLPAASCVVAAMSGSLGLAPTAAAARAGKRIALANKEVLVCAGALITALARQHAATIIPVDSEHSAIFQCLNGELPQTLRRLILTASGGPFRGFSPEQLSSICVEEALRHPNWNMGQKITIDCSTLMNKGLEVIEAHWLFSLPHHAIEVVIHPQSIVHSMVEFCDGSIIAQMGMPTMLLPIQYALTFPERRTGFQAPFDFTKQHTLQFFPPTEGFRCLSLAYDALKEGKSMPAYMNAANEVLVERFLAKQISWLEISSKLESAMLSHCATAVDTIEEILAVDAAARRDAKQL